MVDINRKQAENMLNSFCAALDDAGCKYQADREALSIRISFKGDDFDLAYNIRFDEERQIIRFRSDMPFGVKPTEKADVALAVCHANYLLSVGNFDYNYMTGDITFRMTESFRSSLISMTACLFMLSLALDIVEKFNDKFFLVATDQMSVEQFCAAVKG